MRRELLSIFHMCYKFMDVMDERSAPLWPGIARELRWAASLLPFAFVDTRREWDTVVSASDAEGANSTDVGGFGVVEAVWDIETVQHCGSLAEHWRYQVEDAIAARKHALAQELDARVLAVAELAELPEVTPAALDLDTLRRRTATFSEVPRGAIGDFAQWQLKVRGRWRGDEGILRGEGRALVLALRHRLRAVRARGRRILALVDNLALCLALGKGRAAAPAANRTCREVLALSVLGDVAVRARWIPSEFNPADRPSRLRGPAVSGAAPSVRDARAPWRSDDRGPSATALATAIERAARAGDALESSAFGSGRGSRGGAADPAARGRADRAGAAPGAAGSGAGAAPLAGAARSTQRPPDLPGGELRHGGDGRAVQRRGG